MKKSQVSANRPTLLRQGDTVVVIAGGHKEKRPIKGQIGKIARFVGPDRQRVVVEGLNIVTRHQRATAANQSSGKLRMEAPMHVSNVRFYSEKAKRPVALRMRALADGKRVRGYVDPESKEFVQVDVA